MKKALVILLTLSMLLGLMYVGTSAEVATSVWDGNTTGEAFTGEGTAEKPYVIASAANLAYLAYQTAIGINYEGCYFIQVCNIDLNNQEWYPIGPYSSSPFKGIYNGYGNTVKGLSITTAEAGLGLFGYVFAGAETDAGIANLNVEGKIAIDNAFNNCGIGGLIGWSQNDTSGVYKLVYITNVTTNVELDIKSVNEPRVGGVCGEAFYTVMDNVVNNAKVTVNIDRASGSARTGGISGQSNRTTYQNCVNNGDITSITSNPDPEKSGCGAYAAGFVCMQTCKNDEDPNTTGGTKYINCINNGKITAQTLDGNKNAAGAGGFYCSSYAPSASGNHYVTLEKCLNTGEISAIAGNASVSESYAPAYAGGICARSYKGSTVYTNCINVGTVTATGGAPSTEEAPNTAPIFGGISASWEMAEGDTVSNMTGCMTTTDALLGKDATDPTDLVDCRVATEMELIATIDALKAAIVPSQIKINNFATDAASVPADHGESIANSIQPIVTTEEENDETTAEVEGDSTTAEVEGDSTTGGSTPDNTAAPSTTTDEGCGSVVACGIALVAILGTAIVFKKN